MQLWFEIVHRTHEALHGMYTCTDSDGIPRKRRGTISSTYGILQVNVRAELIGR